MNRVDQIEVLIVISIIAAIVIITYRYLHKSTPENIVREVDRAYLSNTIPAYMLIQRLEEALQDHPEHPLLLQKLQQLQTESPPSHRNHKTLFGVLLIFISLLGTAQVYFFLSGHANLYGLIVGIIFLVIAYLIHREYRIL